jgi:hypothetical protein
MNKFYLNPLCVTPLSGTDYIIHNIDWAGNTVNIYFDHPYNGKYYEMYNKVEMEFFNERILSFSKNMWMTEDEYNIYLKQKHNNEFNDKMDKLLNG